MPRYDYKCPECEHEFEVKQSFSEDPVASCPSCGTASQRVFHAVPVVFKGSGFYVNEYGKGSGRNEQSSDDSMLSLKASLIQSQRVSQRQNQKLSLKASLIQLGARKKLPGPSRE